MEVESFFHGYDGECQSSIPVWPKIGDQGILFMRIILWRRLWNKIRLLLLLGLILVDDSFDPLGPAINNHFIMK